MAENLTSAELLDRLMSGVNDEEVADLIATAKRVKLREDYLLDYKHGGWLTCADKQEKAGEPKKASDRILAWVTGFANGGGGVLVVGVEEDSKVKDAPGSVTGCSVPGGGKQTLTQWVSDILRGVAHLFAPVPRIYEPTVEGETVLVIAVHRAPNLISVREKGETGHYLRFGDGTRWIPPYLHADLVLGRRSRPNLRLVLKTPQLTLNRDGAVWMRGTFELHVWNEGFVWADDLRVGVVGFTANTADPMGGEPAIAHELLQAIDITPSKLGLVCRHKQGMRPYDHIRAGDIMSNSAKGSAPFETRKTEQNFGFDVFSDKANARWYGAAYVVCRGMTPDWYQLTIPLVFPGQPFLLSQERLPLIPAENASLTQGIRPS